MTEHVVIVGAGQAGAQTALSLRQLEFAGPITLIGDEAFAPYERPPLSKAYLAGDVPVERLYMRPPEFYAGRGIALRTHITVRSIDRARGAVTLNDGTSLSYSHLVLATGGRVRRMNCPGADLPGVHYLRSIADVDAIRPRLVDGCKLVIVGGGYIGLEVAAVAVKRGCAVTVLEALPHVLSRAVAPELSKFYADLHRRHWVDVRTATMVMAFEGSGQVERVVCNTDTLPVDLVIVGIGITPEVALAEHAGLAVDNGIVVDACARTEDPRIFAAGDCTNHPNAILGKRLRLESVPNALGQGKAAAAAILGKAAPYNEVPWFWSDQYDLKLQMTGLTQPGDQVVVRGDMAAHRFSACYLRDGVFVACQAVNLAKDFLQSKKLIAAHARPDPARLADPATDLKDL